MAHKIAWIGKKNMLFDSLSYILSGLRKSFKMFFACGKGRESGWKEGGEKEKRKKRKKVDLLSSPDFSVPHFTLSAFSTVPFPAPAPSISLTPEGQLTRVYIWKTLARLPELGMLKRPGLAFFGFQLWQLSHPHP